MNKKSNIARQGMKLILFLSILFSLPHLEAFENQNLAPKTAIPQSPTPQPNKDAPLSLREAIHLLNQGALGKIIPYNEEDLRYSAILAQSLLKHKVENLVIVGSAVPCLTLLYPLMGKSVVFVDLDDNMIETFKMKYDFLCQTIGKKLPLKFVKGEIGDLDLESNNLAPRSFDAVLMVDLLGFPPKGSPRKWLLKARELLQVDPSHPGYLVIDEREFTDLSKIPNSSPRKQLPDIFPSPMYNLEMLSDRHFGVYNYTSGNNSLWKISSTSPFHYLCRKKAAQEISC